MRASTNVENVDEYSSILKEFGGVDFSTPTLNVSPTRAVQAVNFINKHGSNCKRNGYEQILQFTDENYNELAIDGIFSFNINNQDFIIVYAGKRFYRVYNDGEYRAYDNLMSTCTYEPASLQTSRLKSNKTFCFVNSNRAYFVGCGDYLVFGTWDNEHYELRRVFNNIDTTIPTTNTNIDSEDSELGISQVGIDDVNVLTVYRRNGFIGKNTSASYQVDTKKIDVGTPVTLVINEGNENDEKHYTNAVYDNETQSYSYTNELFDESDNSKVGDIDFVKGRITLNSKTTDDANNGISNIIITFSYDAGNADLIQNCEFGEYFGTDGHSDRLFLSGNVECKYSSFYSGDNDFTYFSDSNRINMGNTAVVGYTRLSDGTMAVLKEDSQQEASVYYLTGTFTLNDELYGAGEQFSYTAGASGIGAVSRYAIDTLAGDNLFLSRSGVFGLELSSNVATTERFAKERSSYIAKKLKEHEDLSKAVSIVFDNRYMLFIDNVVYVADARTKSRAKGSMSDTFDYEWYYWDNIPAVCVAEVNGQLWFGTSDGKICVFDNLFTDRTYVGTISGQLTISNSTISYSSELNVSEDMPIKVVTKNVYSEIMNTSDIVQINSGIIKTASTVMAKLFDNMSVYADSISETCNLQVDTEYIIKEINRNEQTFGLYLNGELVMCTGIFRLCELVTDKTLYIANLDADLQTFKLKKYVAGSPLTIVNYNDNAISDFRCYLYNVKNVRAEWITPFIDCDYFDRIKVLKQLTLVTEPSTNSKLTFGYITKGSSGSFKSQGAGQFSFNDIDFNDFTFDNAFASSFTVRVRDWFNYIAFRFVSDNDSDCAINALKMVYTIKNKIRGLK